MFKIRKSEFLQKDKDVQKALHLEFDRLNNSIELIASENVVSGAVLEAAGSIFTNKYAEGYPHARYYGGCINVDSVEDLAKNRLSKLFSCEEKGYSVNVQAHSGSGANMAVYMAMLKPGDKILGMDLSAGGHLTHGSKVNFSGKLYDFISYGVSESGMIDYDALEKLAIDEKPKMIVAGASAYPRIIDFKRIREIADRVGSLFMVDMAHIAGLVATGLHPTPIGVADIITSTTHKTLRGPRGGIIIFRKEFEKKINSSIFPGIQGGPLMHIIAAKAVAFGEALSDEFERYQKKILENSKAMAEVLIENGVNLVSGGTDNHLLLLDLRSLGITGKDAERALEEIGITTNKNGIPNDPQPPKVTSGIRIGTPAITTRGFGVEESEKVAKIIATRLKNIDNEEIKSCGKKTILELCKKFPVYEVE